MVGIMANFMDVECGRSYVDELFSNEEEKRTEAVISLKNSLIGSNRQKQSIIEQGIVPRLINLLIEPKSSPQLQVDVAYTINSLAKGSEAHLKAVIDSGVIPALLQGLYSLQPKVVSACLCCLKTILAHSDAPIDMLYADPGLVPHMIELMPAASTENHVAIATIFTNACKTRDHQDLLASAGAVSALAVLLCSPLPDVQLPALQCLAYLVFRNDDVAKLAVASPSTGFVSGMTGGDSNGSAGNNVAAGNRSEGSNAAAHTDLLDRVVSLMSRDKKDVEMQLAAARCLTYLYRCEVMSESDPRISYKALPCLVRMCKKSEKVEHRVMAAETLAYLTEVSAEMQQIAAISNHLIPTISSFLWWEPDPTEAAAAAVLSSVGVVGGPTAAAVATVVSPVVSADSAAAVGLTRQQQIDAAAAAQSMPRSIGQQEHLTKDMKKAAFRVFSSLGANDEDIRKRIIETDNLMECLVNALEDNNPKLRMAAVGCLHSLSRSVQLLRTTFQDHPVWRPLTKMLSVGSSTASVEMLIVASSTLCNLLLEFSPSKEPILDSGAVDMLCSLTHKYEPALRLNGVWGLMNMAFQAEQRIKVQIIATLGPDQIFRLLSDPDMNVVMKTLGLLRNLLSNKHHIDHIMALHGKQIMQAVVLTLESENVHEVKEQALCILANIADGDSAKQFIMSNEDVLKKVTSYMLHGNTKLQIAAVFCITNLIWADDEGSQDRQTKLRDIGVYKILQQLLGTTDTALFEKVKGALQQFT